MDSVAISDHENLTEIFLSLRKVPDFTTDIIKNFFERCKHVEDILDILISFRETKKKI